MKNKIFSLFLIFSFFCSIASAQESENLKEPELNIVEKADPSRFYNSAIIQGMNKTTAKSSLMEMRIEEKINFTSNLIYYSPYIDLEDFFDEECHLSLVLWIYQYLPKFKCGEEDEKVFHLLYNIIIIFEVLPINTSDLFELKIFEKLNKIRKLIKNKNLYTFQHLDNLLNYWTTFCTDNCLKKRSREEVEKIDEENFFLDRTNKKVYIYYLIRNISMITIFI
jgi:hypothetical protein